MHAGDTSLLPLHIASCSCPICCKELRPCQQLQAAARALLGPPGRPVRAPCLAYQPSAAALSTPGPRLEAKAMPPRGVVYVRWGHCWSASRGLRVVIIVEWLLRLAP